MNKGRLEAFSDGVVAIIITIMVLDLKVPESADMSALKPALTVFFSYVISFVFVAIYWNNHHHLFQPVKRINGRILWANMHLLFWLSLIPFATRWMDEHVNASLPVAVYGVILLFCAIAYSILTRVLVVTQDPDSILAKAVGKDVKGGLSVLIYLLAIPLAFVKPWIAYTLFILVALMWVIPDRRIENHLE
ncbi:MAG: TMEM175 family protein [Gammaproteobacteria bacterium]|nr:TMEM175 family protein [Gammaproteobacteria bacterium]